jgi:DNA-binding LytR/AlgR family response regulator
MSNIKVGIIEDEMIIGQGIYDALEQLGYMPVEPVGNYTEAMEMIDREQPDILLIDIQLSGKKDGIDVAEKVKEEYNIPFIFLTANSDPGTVERAKLLCPPAYLVKPFNKEELYTSIEVCLHNYTYSQKNNFSNDKDNYLIKDFLFIKQGPSFKKIALNEILYLESENVYVHIHTLNNKLLVRSTLQKYLDTIGSSIFFRVHRSYAININHLETINAEDIFVNGRKIPIGKTQRDELLNIVKIG